MVKYFFDICCMKKYNYPNMENDMLKFISNFDTITSFSYNDIKDYTLSSKKENNQYIFCLYFQCIEPTELIYLIKDLKGTNFYISFITKENDDGELLYIYNNLANYEEMGIEFRNIYRDHLKKIQAVGGNDLYLHQVLTNSTKLTILY